MEWEFAPADVVKGRCGYGLAEFRRDLAEEVRRNLGDGDAFLHAYHLLYDLCHALATSKDFEAHLAAHAHHPPTVRFLRELRPLMENNAAMLGAILQRQIAARVEAGMPLERAVADVAEWHRLSVADPPPVAIN